ncbi:pilus assembly protein TadG-related protein [Pseudomonas guariconensis]|uniref:pilus assembly protein TadG-related protein n=1 Tax=Pseudomonas guariconensis TaxID=1288410 RepID=UPI00384DBC65
MVLRYPARQRGAIGLMAALTLGLALLFMLLVVDSGRLYLEQRKLQRIADMAALEAAGQHAVCTGTGPQAPALARTAATRNGHDPSNPLMASCGHVQTGADHLRTFTVDASRNEAIRVQVSNTVSTSVAAGVFALVKGDGLPLTSTLTASAVASVPTQPQAMLRIRSTLVKIDTRQAALLNALLVPLGGNLQLDVAGWQGLADTQLNLLKYLDQLAVDLNIKAGDYQTLLDTNASATQLLQAAVKVLQQSGTAVDVVSNLGKVALAGSGSSLHLGELVDIQNGTAKAGLDASLQLLQLVHGMLMVAASDSAAGIDLSPSVLGLANGRVRVKVIEPQQISSVGDPSKDELRVHTAQVKVLVSVDLPLLDSVVGLVNAVLDLAAPLTNVLNNLLSLNLFGTVQSLTCSLGIPCKVSDIKLMPDKLHLDIGLEIGEATSRLKPPLTSSYSCSPKRLTTLTDRSAVKISVGRFDSPDTFFAQGTVANKALPLIDIGTNVCSRLLILPPVCGTRVPFAGGGIGVRVDSKVLGYGQGEHDLVFQGASEPPDIGLDPRYQAMATANSNVVGSLSDTLLGIHLEAYEPTANSGLGKILVLTAGLLDGVKSILEPLIKNLLSPIIDPLVEMLLKMLGIDLVNAEVGSNLSCSIGRAQLVL